MLRKTCGFTLIEILLVVLLTSILAALVAPLGIEQVEKARAQSEWLTLDREIDRLSLDAFLRGDFVTIYAAGKQLAWEFRGGKQGVIEFEHLFFSPEQRITINPNGIADRLVIEVLQRDRRRSLRILPEVRE
ncbi:MAG: prepilin-type N-terminal cleavage/methylation domain-containing protein [Proteobacteria bacterium]|nr:prepilin-type N-terminal cleavage/methylation domain-containing protein [Pseudomonadota bacterium]